MYLSIYSLAAAILWATVFTRLVSCLRKHLHVFTGLDFYTLLAAVLFCVLRVVFPLELPYTTVIESKKVLPWLHIFFHTVFFSYRGIGLTPAFLAILVWGFGSTLILLKQIRDYLRFRCLLASLPTADDSRLYRLLSAAGTNSRFKDAKIIMHASVPSPALVGFFYPVIILPDISFDDDELLGIFLHESAHFKYHHSLIKLAGELICICFWWNPFLKELPLETANILEMHSDQAVCARLNQEQQIKYLAAITKVFQNRGSMDVSHSFICNFVERPDGADLKQRFQMILENRYLVTKKPVYLALTMLFFLLSYGIILQPHIEPTVNEIGNIDDFPLKYRFYFIETENGYDFYEYPERFIGHFNSVDEIYGNIDGVKIYKSKEDVKMQ